MKYDKLELGDLEVDIFRVMNLDRVFLIKIIGAIKSDYFESNILSKIFVIYQVFFEKLNKLPSESIIKRELIKTGDSEDRINPFLERIFDVERTLEHAEIAYVKDEVETFAIRARMKDAVMQSMDFLAEDNFPAITNAVKDALLFSMDIDKGIDLYDVDERYQRLAENLGDKMQTGFKALDKVLNGGWVKKELYAFMGPPGIGKCQYYNAEIEIEIDVNDPLYDKIKHLAIK